MEIHIHTTVSSNSIRYFKYVQANYMGLRSGKIPVYFYTYCLDARSHRVFSKDPAITQSIALEYGAGSIGHARSIDTAIANFKKGQINIISDTDIAILMKDWDLALEKALCGAGATGVVATRLEDINGFSTGETIYQQYKKKPSTTWMAMSPHYDFSGLTVMPDKDNFIPVATPELSELYQLPIGYFVVKDTGWQVPSYLHDHKIPYFALDIVKPTSEQAIALKGVSPYHDEFHWGGKPFLAHQRGSMKHKFRIDPLSCDFYDACDKYLGNPAWAVFPTFMDRLEALGRDIVELIKKPVRFARKILAHA